jgi:peptide/nickel transport system permease protein
VRFLRKVLLPLMGVLLAVSLITLCLMSLLPGDPAATILGENATEEQIQQLREQMGLNDPLPVRYLSWLTDALQGNFGRSIRSGDLVIETIANRAPVTIEILVLAQIVALLAAIPVGVFTAYRANRPSDHAWMSASLVLLSTPSFLKGVLLVYFFALVLGWFPATGYVPLSVSVLDNLHSLALPVITLALVEFPVYMRLLRSEMIQTLQQPFIAMAKAMGLPPRRILLQHALRPSSINLVTVIGINMGRLIGGAVIIESLFGIPGIGSLLVEAIYEREFLMVQTIVLFVAIAFVLINFTIDVLYAVIDPRIRVAEAD